MIMIVDNTLPDLQNPSYPTQPHSIIANYVEPGKRSGVIRVNIVIKLSIHSLLYREIHKKIRLFVFFTGLAVQCTTRTFNIHPAETLSRYGNMFCTRREDSQRRELLCTILPYAQAYESKRHEKCPKILK